VWVVLFWMSIWVWQAFAVWFEKTDGSRSLIIDVSSGYLGIVDNTFAELMTIYHGWMIANEFTYKFCVTQILKIVLDLISKSYNSYQFHVAVIAISKYTGYVEVGLGCYPLSLHKGRQF